MIFVFSAAFAREYDAEYILHRPWIMFVPLGASLVSSFLLWCVLYGTWAFSRKAPPFWRNYRVFLGMFWLTAPMAWLYAIPVERFMAPAGAVYTNYALLGVVAAWRVFVMIRVATVWTGRSTAGAAILVLLFGDVLVLAAMMFSPWPIIEVMSGGHRTPAEAAHIEVTGAAFCWAVMGFPLLLIAAVVKFASLNRARKRDKPPGVLLRPAVFQPARMSLWMLALLSVVVWAPILPFTQPPLRDQQDPVEQYYERRRQYWRELHEDDDPAGSGASDHSATDAPTLVGGERAARSLGKLDLELVVILQLDAHRVRAGRDCMDVQPDVARTRVCFPAQGGVYAHVGSAWNLELLFPSSSPWIVHAPCPQPVASSGAGRFATIHPHDTAAHFPIIVGK